MNQQRSLLHENIKNISNASVKDGTLRAHLSELKRAESKLSRAEQRVSTHQAKVRDQRKILGETRLRHKQENNPQTKRACQVAANRLKIANQRSVDSVSGFRDIKLIVRDLRAVYKTSDRKEAAKQKAVAHFLKRWEREYDRETKILEKNANKRARWLQSD